MNKTLLKAAWVRAYRSFFQGIVSQIPAGFAVTPIMIQHFKISYVYVIIAILCNAALYAFASFVTCMVGGLPEAQLQETLYDLDNEGDEEYMEEYDSLEDDEEEEDEESEEE